MQVYHSLEEIPFIGKVAITIGNFDGVHLGHAKIFQKLVDEHKNGLQSMVMTFWPHPRKVLTNDTSMRFLTSMQEKSELLKAIGIHHLLIVPFNKEFAEIHAGEFVEHILCEKIGIKKVFLGYDHRFGKNREGSIEYFAKLSAKWKYTVEEIPKQEIEHLAISSSQIRTYLEEGKPELAKNLLGRLYSLSGVITEGKKLGRTIGFPTANLELTFSEKLIPKKGVYAVLVKVKERVFKGMMNIGLRPTVDGSSLSLEVHIFDFSDDIYGQTISIEFVHYTREEQKFPSIEALKKRLKIDREETLALLSDYDI